MRGFHIVVLVGIMLPGKSPSACQRSQFSLIYLCCTFHSAYCVEIPSIPTARNSLNGDALTSPVVFDANQKASIWCSAQNFDPLDGALLALSWWHSNGTRVQRVDSGIPSTHDVYMERIDGNSDDTSYTKIWRRVLHFKNITHSSVGTFNCSANFNGNLSNVSLEIRISGW